MQEGIFEDSLAKSFSPRERLVVLESNLLRLPGRDWVHRSLRHGFHSSQGFGQEAPEWLQVNLGEVYPIDMISSHGGGCRIAPRASQAGRSLLALARGLPKLVVMNRRLFVGSAAAAAAAPLGLGQFPERKGEARLPVGLAAYSFRDHFSWMKGKARKPRGEEMDMFGFVNFCAEHGCHGAELTSYFFPADPDAEYFNRLKRHAFLRGVDVCGTAIGNDFSMGKGARLDGEVVAAKKWLKKAALMGAPHVRFFAGTGKGFAAEDGRVGDAVAALRECAAYAGELGIFIGIENHGAITAEFLLGLVKEVNSPWVGINLDSGNFISDEPYADFERCAPWAVNVQLKVHIRRNEPADLPRLIGLLRKTRYQGYVVLEYESGKPFEEIPGYLRTLRELCG